MFHLDVKNLYFRYTKNGPQILRDISLVFSGPGFYGIYGPNGSGKSTFLRLASGLLRPPQSNFIEGTILYSGLDVFKADPKRLGGYRAYVGPQSTSFFSISVGEFILQGAYIRGIDTEGESEKLLRDLLIWELRSLPLHQLSQGERQLVFLAKALVQRTPCLFLDEAFAHLDIFFQQQVMKVLQDQQTRFPRIIILVSHDVEYLKSYTHHTVVMKHGQIWGQGPSDEILHQSKLEQIYPGWSPSEAPARK